MTPHALAQRRRVLFTMLAGGRPALRVASLAILLACVVSSSRLAHAGDSHTAPRTPEQARQELAAIAEELRAAVLAGDTETILKYTWRAADVESVVHPLGFQSFGVYEAMGPVLRDPKSFVYCLVFDSDCLNEQAEAWQRKHPTSTPRPLDRISIREFLQNRPRPEARVLYFPNTNPHRGRVDFPPERPDGLGMILYVRPGAPGRVPEDPVRTWYPWWGLKYVGLELSDQPRHGWKYVHSVLFNVGCSGGYRC